MVEKDASACVGIDALGERDHFDIGRLRFFICDFLDLVRFKKQIGPMGHIRPIGPFQ